MERCLHGMLQETCSFCNPRKPKRRQKPRHRKEITVHGVEAVTAEKAKQEGYVVIRSSKRDDPSFEQLNEQTTFVHIHGRPLYWAFEEIMRRAPNLRTLRVIPTSEGNLGRRHRALCKQHNVQLITGYHRPACKWTEGEIRSSVYHAQQTFLLNVQGEQKALFEELLTFGFECASMTARYFCLNGEKYLSQRQLAAEFGYSEVLHHYISAKILAVLYYLDSSLEVGKNAKRIAGVLKEKMPRLREQFHADSVRTRFSEKFLTLYGVRLAPNFPLIRLETFEKVLEKKAAGELKALRVFHPEDWKALHLRFGLDKPDASTYRRLEQVGEMMGVTRERVRQREDNAFRHLGIVPAKRSKADKLLALDTL